MLNVIYEDNEIIVCEKPSGIPSQGDKTGDRDMLSIIRDHSLESSAHKKPYIALVHRLDRAVGGIMVFAKTKHSAAVLSKAIQEGNFNKTYLAVTSGQAKDKGRLSDFLIKNQRLNISEAAPPDTPDSKQAILEYTLINSRETSTHDILSLLEISLITGRHHQIRVQLSNANIPIWGDTKYNHNFIKKPGFHTIALWAYRLKFPHPKTGKPMEFKLNPHNKHPFSMFFAADELSGLNESD